MVTYIQSYFISHYSNTYSNTSPSILCEDNPCYLVVTLSKFTPYSKYCNNITMLKETKYGVRKRSLLLGTILFIRGDLNVSTPEIVTRICGSRVSLKALLYGLT